jgi:glycosyltransferase involved in cell wall biosynthesis
MQMTTEKYPVRAKSPAVPSAHRRVLISGGLAVGGTQTHVTLLCSVLRQAGAEVTIASASTNWSFEALAGLRKKGVRVVVSPFGFGLLQMLGKVWAFLAWPFLLRRDYDVLYCIGEGRIHLWLRRFVAAGGFRIYHEIVECPTPGSVVAQVVAQMDGVVANSRRVGRGMSELLAGTCVRTIPFLTSAVPIDPPAPRPPRGNQPLRIAFLGRLAPHKRPDRLVEAWPEWNACAPFAPAQLDFHGGDYDGEGDRLRARIAELGLQDCVRLRGPYTTGDLDRIFAETDIVVLPSRYEGLPLVLVEAMQRGIPIVATSAGGTAELGDDNPDVIVTPGTDWDAFAAGLVTMVKRVRAGEIDGVRLQAWTEARYGFKPVAAAWRKALLAPESYFVSNPLPDDVVIRTQEEQRYAS